MTETLGTSEELERQRYRAVELVRQGESVATVARFLGVHRSSVSRWRKHAIQAGAYALAARPHPHRPARLTDLQLPRLESLLSQGAAAHGWSNHLWTTNRVAILIERQFGIRYHHDHVGRFLRKRLGWSVQKPMRRAGRERNEAAILDWQSRQLPHIAREAQERGAHLVFLDESGFMLTPTVRRTWAPQGRTPVLSAWDRRDRISAISSITVSPKNRIVNLYFDLLPDNTNVHGDDVVEYLRRLRSHLGSRMTILWDGSRVHDRSGAVQQVSRESEPAPKLGSRSRTEPSRARWAWTVRGGW